MNKKQLNRLLEENRACITAREWIGTRTAKKAWDECPRGDWLLWIASRGGVDRKRVVLAACACARLALKFVKADENRPFKAIETAEAWTRGEATIGEVRSAAYAAADAAAYADAYAAAASAATAAAYADAYASAASYAAADARTEMQQKTAIEVREVIKLQDVLKAVRSRKTK